jgi:hypothetical protein
MEIEMVRYKFRALSKVFSPLVILICSSCGTTAATSTLSTTCTTGTDKTETPLAGGISCTTNIPTSAPAWIQNNFHCVTVKVCATTYVFITNDLPPFKTAYYGASSANYTAWNSQGSTRTQNPSTLSSQSITMTVPITPTLKTSNLDATSGAGIDAVGISTYGVVFFNNQAAPGDSLATEFQSFDTADGHPQGTGRYHHHTDPVLLTASSQKALIGVAMDGYPIYGKQNQDGSYPTLDSSTNSVQCTTTDFPSGTYCYHISNGTGVNGNVLNAYFRGTRGSTS